MLSSQKLFHGRDCRLGLRRIWPTALRHICTTTTAFAANRLYGPTHDINRRPRAGQILGYTCSDGSFAACVGDKQHDAGTKPGFVFIDPCRKILAGYTAQGLTKEDDPTNFLGFRSSASAPSIRRRRASTRRSRFTQDAVSSHAI